MNILISGGAGFIGKSLVRKLFLDNLNVTALSRNVERAKQVLQSSQCEVLKWDPEHEDIPTDYLKKTDVIVHLAGESISAKAWTPDRKKLIRDSRLIGLQKLIKCIQLTPNAKVKTIIIVSGVGYYGDRADEKLNETSRAGQGFRAELCLNLENTLFSANIPGVRKLSFRAGIVLDRTGGILGRLVPLYNARLGGHYGNGKQWMSWIHRDDLASLIAFAINNPKLGGVINATAPHPVTWQKFSRTLAEVLDRPTMMRYPGFLLRMFLGERAEVLLDSQRVLPDRALMSGFHFKYTEIEDTLRQTSGKIAKIDLLSASLGE